MSKSIKKNSILNIIKTCASIIYPLITFPYISRVLLPDNVGKVNFAQTFVSYFTLIAMLGIATYAIRECSTVKDDKNKLGEVASQIISINICASVIAYFLLAVTLLLFRQFDNYRILIIVESFTIVCTVMGADWLNSAMEDFKYITMRSIGAQVIALIAMFVFVRSQDDYIKYAIISVLSTSGASMLNIWYRRRYCRIHFTLKIDWKRHMVPIFFLFVMTLSQTILSSTDVTMLGLIKGDYQVGLYSTAHKVTRLIAQVVQSIALVIIPRLSYYFAKNDFENANRLLRKVLLFNITLGFPCVVGVEMLAEEIVYVVGGVAFVEAVPVIRVLILSFLFSLVGGSFLGNAILIPMKKERYYMIVCIITAVVNIILNAALIPKLGAVGAAIATACNGLIIMLLLMMKIDHRIHIHNVKKIFLAPIIGCMWIVFICFVSKNITQIWARVSVSVLLSGLGYGGILILMKNEFMYELLAVFKIKKLGK